MTIGIALSVKSNLGVSPVSSIPYTMTCVWGIEMGKASISYWFWFRSSYCEETSSNYVITISREFGSGGREIGKLLAERFGFHYYDSELIRLAAEKSGFSPEYVEQNDLPMVDQLFAKESALIHELSQRGSCIIVGRLANYILKDIPTAYHVFISADLDAEAARVSARDNISPPLFSHLCKTSLTVSPPPQIFPNLLGTVAKQQGMPFDSNRFSMASISWFESSNVKDIIKSFGVFHT